jgi:hypothetical protein
MGSPSREECAESRREAMGKVNRRGLDGQQTTTLAARGPGQVGRGRAEKSRGHWEPPQPSDREGALQMGPHDVGGDDHVDQATTDRTAGQSHSLVILDRGLTDDDCWPNQPGWSLFATCTAAHGPISWSFFCSA